MECDVGLVWSVTCDLCMECDVGLVWSVMCGV